MVESFGLFPDETGQLTAWDPAGWVVDPSWKRLVADFFATSQGVALGHSVQARLQQNAVIFPPLPLRALALTPLPQVRVVIVGQDPYHGPHQANGLAFSVAKGAKLPPSLRNIYKEIERDPLLPTAAPLHQRQGSLDDWATQGVLLLNSSLTVESGQPGSHADLGWEVLTDNIIQAVWAVNQPVVFMLWGSHAQAKQSLLKPHTAVGPSTNAPSPHLVLCANHPSPLSALRPPVPFLGCGHFSLANAHLAAHRQPPIVW